MDPTTRERVMARTEVQMPSKVLNTPLMQKLSPSLFAVHPRTLSIPVDEILITRQSLQSHGTASMELSGGHPDFSTEAISEAIGKSHN